MPRARVRYQGLYSLTGGTSYRDISFWTFQIALKFDRFLGSVAAEMPVKFQDDVITIAPNLAVSRLYEISIYPLVNTCPGK